MDETTKEKIAQITDSDPTSAFFNLVKGTFHPQTAAELIRVEDVVNRNGALFFGQMWQLDRDDLIKLLKAEHPPLACTWVETLEFLSFGRKFATSGDSTPGASSVPGVTKVARFVETGARRNPGTTPHFVSHLTLCAA